MPNFDRSVKKKTWVEILFAYLSDYDSESDDNLLHMHYVFLKLHGHVHLKFALLSEQKIAFDTYVETRRFCLLFYWSVFCQLLKKLRNT